ncbi:MAG: FitA-like ribbon-helix-helix domain-containing protein [Pseudomonadota bacterium]
MAAMTIRNIDNAILERLRERAATHGRSMEDEVREILRAALSTEMPCARSLGRAIHERFAVLGGVALPKLARDVIENPCRASFHDIIGGFYFISLDGGGGKAFVCRRTGKVYWHSEIVEADALPEDIEDEEKYIRVPDKRRLNLGKQLVLRFARQCLPQDFDEVEDAFSRKGGYAKFEVLLRRRHALDRWHEFEARAQEEAIREWCRENSIELIG